MASVAESIFSAWIDESKRADALQLSITDLYYSSLALNVTDERWEKLYARICGSS